MAKKESKGRNISIWINDQDLMDRILKFSKKIKVEPRQFIKKSINVSIEEMMILDNIGYIRATLMFKSIKNQYLNSSTNHEDTDIDNAEKIKPFSIMLDHEIIDQLDYFQQKLSFKSRNDLIIKLIKLNLRDLRYFDATGLLTLAVFLRDKWRKQFNETQEAIEKGEIKIDLKDK